MADEETQQVHASLFLACPDNSTLAWDQEAMQCSRYSAAVDTVSGLIDVQVSDDEEAQACCAAGETNSDDDLK